MNPQEFLQKLLHLQYGIMFHKLHDIDFASIGWCRTYKSPYFNYAQINSEIDKNQLKQIEKELEDLNREPAIYFENSPRLDSLKAFLNNHGYQKKWEDSWMFYGKKPIEEDGFDEIIEVSNKNDLEEFIETFDACYQKDDPQNPYGELGDYIDVTRAAWHKYHKTGKLQYFTVFKKDEPVAVSTLTNFAGIGYISNVGSKLNVRGEGFGKRASLYCVAQSRKNGNDVHSLATEEGKYPNEFYKRIGFETKFTTLGYTKRNSG